MMYFLPFQRENFNFDSRLCFQIELSEDDIKTILTTLMYDGVVEKKLTVEGVSLYKAIDPLLSTPGLIRTPCGICPVSGRVALKV